MEPLLSETNVVFPTLRKYVGCGANQTNTDEQAKPIFVSYEYKDGEWV